MKSFKILTLMALMLISLSACSNNADTDTNDMWKKVSPSATPQPKPLETEKKTDTTMKNEKPMITDTEESAPSSEAIENVTDENNFGSMESKPWQITMGYPKKWYWGNQGGYYGFSPEELTEDSENTLELQRYTEYPGKAGKGGFNQISEGIYENTTDTRNFICKPIENEIFCLLGNEDLHDTMVSMIKTLQKNKSIE